MTPNGNDANSARIELAIILCREVVEELGLADINEYTPLDYDGVTNRIYKIESQFGTGVFAEIATEFGIVKIEFSLFFAANHIIRLLERLYSDESASEVLKPTVLRELQKRNIDISTLFNSNTTEDDIKAQTKQILGLFIQNAPILGRMSTTEALSSSIFGYFQHVVKPYLKNHWEELRLPKDFNLILDSEVDQVREYNISRKKFYLGDRKQLLNINTLADEAKELRKQYTDAKSFYLLHKEKFMASSKRVSNEDWKANWLALQAEYFPHLSDRALDQIEQLRPFELARLHLADFYNYNEDVIKEKVSHSKKLKAKNNGIE